MSFEVFSSLSEPVILHTGEGVPSAAPRPRVTLEPRVSSQEIRGTAPCRTAAPKGTAPPCWAQGPLTTDGSPCHWHFLPHGAATQWQDFPSAGCELPASCSFPPHPTNPNRNNLYLVFFCLPAAPQIILSTPLPNFTRSFLLIYLPPWSFCVH